MIKIALSCHLQKTEEIQWIVTRKNRIYHGCESCKPSRHGKTRKSVVSQWWEDNQQTLKKTPVEWFALTLGSCVACSFGHVFSQYSDLWGIKKNTAKWGKGLEHVPRFMSAYVTGERTCDICDVISLQHETEAIYILSFTLLEEEVDCRFSMLF